MIVIECGIAHFGRSVGLSLGGQSFKLVYIASRLASLFVACLVPHGQVVGCAVGSQLKTIRDAVAVQFNGSKEFWPNLQILNKGS